MYESDVAENRARYLYWLRTQFPELYVQSTAPLMRRAREVGMAGFLDTLVGGFKSVVANVASTLPGLAKTYAEYDVQKRLIEANTKRASQGLAPIRYDAMGRLVVDGGIPYTQADLQLAQTQLMSEPAMSNDWTPLIWIGGILVAGFLLLRR